MSKLLILDSLDLGDLLEGLVGMVLHQVSSSIVPEQWKGSLTIKTSMMRRR